MIAGPCVVESEELSIEIAQTLSEIANRLDIPYVFKASYRKANRTSSQSFRGIGDDRALDILRVVKNHVGVAITTDVHEIAELESVVDVVDMIQIPAFLSRQTALIEASAMSGCAVNIKKGQFMSAEAAIAAADKARCYEKPLVMLTERGNSFGYNDLVVDGRNIALMSESFITVMDCTHATQQPNQSSNITGGQNEYAELMARIGIVAGARGIFIETHPHPKAAPSDARSMIPLKNMSDMLYRLKELFYSYSKVYA